MNSHEVYTSPAIFSECGLYRYTLTRMSSMLSILPLLLIMLNPSTATATHNDATTRRGIGFARSLGFGYYIAANVFAYRSTDPKSLYQVEDPVGPKNDAVLRMIAEEVHSREGLIVCAWGAHGKLRQRGQEVTKMLSHLPLHVFGLTRHGEPKHPLYLPSDTQPALWKEAA